jgi:hypothetical protein
MKHAAKQENAPKTILYEISAEVGRNCGMS